MPPNVTRPCAFVFLSIPRQMKNFFAWGMIFLAVGIVQLQHDIFEDRRSWLIALVIGGLVVMLLAMHYANLRMMISRRFHKAR